MDSASREACAASAAALLADTTHGTTGGCGALSVGSAGGHSSMITCALVPLMPNDDTPARRARPLAGHDWASVNNDTAPADQSTCGLGTSTCKVAGSTPGCIAWTSFFTPAHP